MVLMVETRQAWSSGYWCYSLVTIYSIEIDYDVMDGGGLHLGGNLVRRQIPIPSNQMNELYLCQKYIVSMHQLNLQNTMNKDKPRPILPQQKQTTKIKRHIQSLSNINRISKRP